MKCITLWQYYASAIALGLKRNETRSWATKYRGPIAIHAAKRPLTHEEMEGFHNDPILCDAFRKAGLTRLSELPLGAVVATAELVNIRSMNDRNWVNGLSPLEKALGDYTPGRVAWVLSDIVRLPEPIPAMGQQGIWEWKQ